MRKSVFITAAGFLSPGFFKGFPAFGYGKIDQPCSTDRIRIGKAGELINKTRYQQNHRHIYTDPGTVCISNYRFGVQPSCRYVFLPS